MGAPAGAELYLRSSPVRFAAAPLVHAGGSWRIADRSKRHWPEDPLLETLIDGAWAPVRAARVDRLSGACDLPDAAENTRVRATGLFLPLALVGSAAGWKLDLQFLGGHSLDGGSSAFSGARIGLLDVELDPVYLEELERPLLAYLHAGGGGYEAVGRLLGERIPIAAAELALAIEPDALTYTAA